jgi:predicted DNA-binding transcriptional regulator AlpA
MVDIFPDRLLTEKELAAWLGISLPTLQRMRSSGSGPHFVQLSVRRIAYRKREVEAWLAARTTDRIGGSQVPRLPMLSDEAPTVGTIAPHIKRRGPSERGEDSLQRDGHSHV